MEQMTRITSQLGVRCPAKADRSRNAEDGSGYQHEPFASPAIGLRIKVRSLRLRRSVVVAAAPGRERRRKLSKAPFGIALRRSLETCNRPGLYIGSAAGRAAVAAGYVLWTKSL